MTDGHHRPIIQGLTHTLWQLIYETEDAFIPAAFFLVHQGIFEFKTQVFVLVFLYLSRPSFAALTLYFKGQKILGGLKPVVEYVANLFTINRHKIIPGLYFQFFSYAASLDTRYFDFICFHSDITMPSYGHLPYSAHAARKNNSSSSSCYYFCDYWLDNGDQDFTAST